jgi:Fuc2NAc and GlcNAc transferase
VVWLGAQPELHVPGQVILSQALNHLVAVLGIVWVLNLYNFMDGIDGLAASEAIFVSWGGAFLLMFGGAPPGVAVAAAAFGAACVGFLLWNWPPAKIFMGDVGSGYIGYTIAVFALAASRESAPSLAAWLILSGVFIVDASVTLLRRLARRERVFAAHRSHAYQWLSRRWGGHKAVTVAVLAMNVLWLLPWALFATLYPRRALWGAASALGSLVIVVLVAGAGRPEPVRFAPLGDAVRRSPASRVNS